MSQTAGSQSGPSVSISKGGSLSEKRSYPAGPDESLYRGEILDLTAIKRVKETLGRQADTMFPTLLQGFFDDGVRLLADARRAVQQNNLKELRRAAHTLKSSSATFGATALSTVARELDNLARHGNPDGADELIERAEQEYTKAKAALEQIDKGKENGQQTNNPDRR
jgi:HPt (histidine-containing phosphotransfer) domain-containing protein